MKVKNKNLVYFILDDKIYSCYVNDKLNSIYITVDKNGIIKYHDLEPYIHGDSYISYGDSYTFGKIYKKEKFISGIFHTKINNSKYNMYATLRISNRKETYIADILNQEFFMFDNDYNLYHYMCEQVDVYDEDYVELYVKATNHKYNICDNSFDTDRYSNVDHIDSEEVNIIDISSNDRYIFKNESDMLKELKRRKQKDSYNKLMENI